MEIIRDYKACPDDAKGAVVALGNFDGVHIGHKAVIEHTMDIAVQQNKASAVLTFEPHPITVVKPHPTPLRITPFRLKAQLLEALGVDIMFALHFTKAFSEITAQDFITTLLHHHLNVSHIVIGHDFIFGHQRGGNAALLKEMTSTLGIGFSQLDAVKEQDTIFSSTIIRTHLKEGRIAEATTLLGHPYIIEGKVRRGKAIGTTLGFPTANIILKDQLRPAFGVYAVELRIEGEDNWRPAIANIGNKPTIGSTKDLVEVHLFDFNDTLYDKRVYIKLLAFFRPEQAFDTLDALKTQIAKDCEQANAFFKRTSIS